ncbi:MAG TPA: hypothetical protein PKE31_18875, partial [Pseudomonadota bacterium]|nr:hypothetical protein [Pseudomonadota bacterium]
QKNLENAHISRMRSHVLRTTWVCKPLANAFSARNMVCKPLANAFSARNMVCKPLANAFSARNMGV